MPTTSMTTVALRKLLSIVVSTVVTQALTLLLLIQMTQTLIMLFTKVTMMQYPQIHQSKKLKIIQIFHHLSQL